MGLSLKNPRTTQLVRELAATTGETLTEAIERAVAERLDRVRARPQARAERLRAIGRDCAARLSASFRTMNPDDLLYDERGLPR